MNKTKFLSFAVLMAAMTGMTGITFNDAYAGNNGVDGVGKGGYQLNLLAKNWTSEDEITCDNNGHRIFIPMQGKFKILLSEGPFAVTDCNATDKGKTAGFQLPNPIDLDGDGVTDDGLGCDIESKTCTIGYGVGIRVLGTPGGSLKIGPTCAEADLLDADGNPGQDGVNEQYCSTDDIMTVTNANGKKGGAKFTDVSKELLTICVDFLDDGVDPVTGEPIGDGECDERIALFDDDFEGFLWNFDNWNARTTQLRFTIVVHTVG